MIIIYMYFLLLYKLLIIQSVEINVNNSNDFINGINECKNSECLLKIDNEIYIENNIDVSTSLKKLHIVGKNRDDSLIHLNNDLYISGEVEEVIFENINVHGKINCFDNKRVTLSNINIFGAFKVNLTNYPSGYVHINKLNLYADEPTQDHGLVIRRCNITIENSNLYGNEQYEAKLINYSGLKTHTLNILNTLVDGKFRQGGISMSVSNLNINNSTFINTYSGEYSYGGSVFALDKVKTVLNNTYVKNAYSNNNGGVIFLTGLEKSLFSENLYAYNCTAVQSGSIIYSYGGSLDNIINLKNTTQINLKEFPSGNGQIAFLEQPQTVIIQGYYGESLYAKSAVGSLFSMYNDVVLELEDIKINKAEGIKDGGLFIQSNSPGSNGASISVTNCKLYNLSQTAAKTGSFFLWLNTGKAEVNNCYLKNLSGIASAIIYNGNSCELNVNNLEVEDVNTKQGIPLYINDSDFATTVKSYFSGLNFKNINNIGALFYIRNGNADVSYSSFKTVRNFMYNNPESILDSNYFYSTIGVVRSDSSLSIKYCNFDDVYGEKGIITDSSGEVIIENSEFTKNFYKYGIVTITTEGFISNGKYTINDCKFINNEGIRGGVFYVGDIKTSNTLTVSKSLFDSNKSKIGGVIYSASKYTNDFVKFIDCEFNNNISELGSISYSLNANTEPYFSNYSELTKDRHNFYTNPTYITLTMDNGNNNFNILSGDILEGTISCTLYDDYNNLITFPSDFTAMTSDDLVLYEITTNDIENSLIIGQYRGYCWGSSCDASNIRIVGNPGNYTLTFSIVTFGLYNSFENNYETFNVRINECNSTYLYKNRDDSRLKSCYLPKCNPSCNTGICVNDNVCDCGNTNFRGQYCNEYYLLERNNYIDITLIVILCILSGLSSLLIVGVIIYRNKPIIKQSGYDFLVIILVGTIFNYLHCIVYVKEVSEKDECYISQLSLSIGFSLIYGSIMVKTLRIYKIFKGKKRFKMGIKKRTMFIIIFGLLIFQIFIFISWRITNTVEIVNKLTNDHQMYTQCYYPPTKNLNVLLKYGVLFVGSYLAYEIRNVPKNYKEDLAVPVYICCLMMVFIEFVSRLNIYKRAKDFISAIGIIIYTFVVIWFIYITKFYNLFVLKNIENKRESVRSSRPNSVRKPELIAL